MYGGIYLFSELLVDKTKLGTIIRQNTENGFLQNKTVNIFVRAG